LGRSAAGESDQEGLLLPVQLALATGTGLLLESHLEPFEDEALTGALDGRVADVQGVSDGEIAEAIGGHEQGMSPTNGASGRFAFLDESFQAAPFLGGQIDDIALLGHGNLLSGIRFPGRGSS
jgi:hypothetical protein